MTVAEPRWPTVCRMELGKLGLWTFQLDLQPMARAREAVAELEALGYGAIWVPEAVGREPFANCSMLLSGGERTRLAMIKLLLQPVNLLILDDVAGHVPQLTIIDLPSFKADPARHGTNGEVVIALNFAKRLVLIGGTSYAGEIKKSVFTIMNDRLPQKGVGVGGEGLGKPRRVLRCQCRAQGRRVSAIGMYGLYVGLDPGAAARIVTGASGAITVIARAARPMFQRRCAEAPASSTVRAVPARGIGSPASSIARWNPLPSSARRIASSSVAGASSHA